MKQTIVLHYISFPAVIAEMAEKHPTRIDLTDPEKPTFLVDFATKYIFNGSETLVAMYVDTADQDYTDMVAMESVNVLGTYEDIFSDPDKCDIYDRVYDQTPVEFDDEECGPMTFTPPERFVVFA